MDANQTPTPAQLADLLSQWEARARIPGQESTPALVLGLLEALTAHGFDHERWRDDLAHLEPACPGDGLMAELHNPQDLPPGMTRCPVLMPVDQYAQLCVVAQREGLDPADLVGLLIVASWQKCQAQEVA